MALFGSFARTKFLPPEFWSDFYADRDLLLAANRCGSVLRPAHVRVRADRRCGSGTRSRRNPSAWSSTGSASVPAVLLAADVSCARRVHYAPHAALRPAGQPVGGLLGAGQGTSAYSETVARVLRPGVLVCNPHL